MKIEEAIAILENSGWWGVFIPITTIEGRSDEDKLHQAIDMAISVLRSVSREQVEKVWRGEWQYHPEDYDELTWTCSRCGEVWTLIDGTPDDNNMDFCPACGLPMTDKAVQMVMERLEALYE